jgi:hypothetical protein
MHLLSFSISHFLNCFLTMITSSSADYIVDELSPSGSTSYTGSNTAAANGSQSSAANAAAQKANNKKKNKKQQQQRKQNPFKRNGELTLTFTRKETSRSSRITGIFLVDLKDSLATVEQRSQI